MKKSQPCVPRTLNPEKPSVPSPPPELDRPRNGFRSGDALGVDKFSGPSGGKKSPKPFTPLVDRAREKSRKAPSD